MPSPINKVDARTSAANQEIVPESKTALRQIAISMGIAIAVAAVEVIATFLPQVAEVAGPLLPYGIGGILVGGAAAAQAWLLKKAKDYHKVSVNEALQIQRPAGAPGTASTSAQSSFYTKREKE